MSRRQLGLRGVDLAGNLVTPSQMASTEPKSVIDILEHLSMGGVHIERQSTLRGSAGESSRESVFGGVMSAEIVSHSHALDSAPRTEQPPTPSRRRR